MRLLGPESEPPVPAVLLLDLLDVGTRLAIRRHLAAVFLHRPGAGVVGGERELHLAIVAIEQLFQVGDAGA